MPNTPNLGLPLMAAAQSQKHITHNDAILSLDAIVLNRILGFQQSVPPATPSQLDAYILSSTPSGAWASQANKIAVFIDGAWKFYIPRAGWSFPYGNFLLIFDGTTWIFHALGSISFSTYNSINQNYTAGAWQSILADTVRHNDGGALSLPAGVATFTAPRSKAFNFNISSVLGAFPGAPPTTVFLAFSVNGTIWSDTIVSIGDATLVPGESSLNQSVILKLNAGDIVVPKILFVTNDGSIFAGYNSFSGSEL